MMLSHRFGSSESLDRAIYWLNRHGFAVSHSDAAGHDGSRVSLNCGIARASAALALIDSIERSDPQGCPGMLDAQRAMPHHSPAEAEGIEAASTTTPIHWERRDPHPATDPLCCKVCEYMLGRWE